MKVEITVDDGAWDSGLEDDIVRPIAKKAINKYSDNVIIGPETQIETTIDGYQVRLIRNFCVDNPDHKLLFPESREYQINVEVGIPIPEGGVRWFVGIYYKFEDGSWAEEDIAKRLNSYEMVKPISGGPMEVDLNEIAESKRLLLEKGADPEKKVKCPLCKTEELVQDDKFAPPGIHWYCPKCRGFWNSSYINGFWTGYREAHEEAREIVDGFNLEPLHDALKKHDKEYGNCTIPRGSEGV